MKRFFCTVCKRVRRVRKLPVIVHENMNAAAVIERFGECDKHSIGNVKRFERLEYNELRWSEANKKQADARMNRTNSKVKKVR